MVVTSQEVQNPAYRCPFLPTFCVMSAVSYSLFPNSSWPRPDASFPVVQASLSLHSDALHITWQVQEEASCFRAECTQDGDPCWQDSCVELFVRDRANPALYRNFEWNSRGACLAAIGPDRHGRTPLSPQDMATLSRTPGPLVQKENLLIWTLNVILPATLFGSANFNDLASHSLTGNLYKCADKSKAPHWLSAFPIDTPKPDFHRPEFFQKLL